MLFPKDYSRLALCSPKGPATTGISRNERRNENKSLSDKPDIGTRLNTFKRRAKKAKVILRSTLFDLFQVRFRSQKDQDSKSVSNLYRCIDFGLIGFHILGNC